MTAAVHTLLVPGDGRDPRLRAALSEIAAAPSAAASALDAVVLFSLGASHDELLAAKPNYLVQTPADLLQLLLFA